MYIIIIVIFLILVGVYIYWYNKLVSGKQDVTQAWSDIDVQLKRRHDLIPNLITIVKSYAKYEKGLLEKITQMRAKAMTLDTNDIEEKALVEKELEKSTQSLLAVAESYPDLKANSEFLNLQQKLVDTEDEIASARRIYNGNVAHYNTLVMVFPTNIIARINNFAQSSFFQKD